jgi:hypothetical protein
MAELPAIAKDQKSPQGYQYRGIEQITKEAQGLFAEYGIVFAPQVEMFEQRDLVVNSKPWTDQRLLVRYKVYGPGGIEDFIEVCVPGIGRDNSDKGANKAMSQAFKYALLQVLCIADAKDDADADASHEAEPPASSAPATPVERPPAAAAADRTAAAAPPSGFQPPAGKASEAQVKLIHVLIGKTAKPRGMEVEQAETAIKADCGVAHFSELTKIEASTLITKLQNWAKEYEAA